MRRKDREMGEDFALSVADRCEYAVLAMTAEDGTPYCIPLSPVRIGKALYFHCAKSGRKIDLLRKENRVCVTCVGEIHRMENKFTTEFASAVVFGQASEVTDDQSKVEILRQLCLRHTPLNMAEFDAAIARSLARTAVWKITIEEITGKRKKYGPDGRELHGTNP